MSLDLVGRAHDVDDAMRERGGVGGLGDGRLHDCELVSAHARDRIRLPHHGAQPVGHELQELVPGRVAEGIVDGLEVVQVEQERGHDLDLDRRLDRGLEALAFVFLVLGCRIETFTDAICEYFVERRSRLRQSAGADRTSRYSACCRPRSAARGRSCTGHAPCWRASPRSDGSACEAPPPASCRTLFWRRSSSSMRCRSVRVADGIDFVGPLAAAQGLAHDLDRAPTQAASCLEQAVRRPCPMVVLFHCHDHEVADDPLAQTARPVS